MKSCQVIRSVVCGLALIQPVAGRANSPAPVRADPKDYQACGATSLYVAARILKVDVTLSAVNERVDPDGDAISSFVDLDTTARSLGLSPVGLNLDIDELPQVAAPAIVQVRTVPGTREGDHFIVYLGSTTEGDVVVLEPPLPPQVWLRGFFQDRWTGNVLALTRTPAEAEALRARMDRGPKGWLTGLSIACSVILGLCTGALWLPILMRRVS